MALLVFLFTQVSLVVSINTKINGTTESECLFIFVAAVLGLILGFVIGIANPFKIQSKTLANEVITRDKAVTPLDII